VLPFGRHGTANRNAISTALDYAKFYSRSDHAVIHVYDEAGKVIESTSARAISKSGNTSAVLLIIHVGPLIGSAMARQVERAGFCDITYNDGEIAGLKKVASILLFLFGWHALCVLWP
jgi:hypothetical protein